MKKVIFTLDLEPDHASIVKKNYSLWQIDKIQSLLKLFKKYNLPLTVFVVAKSLKEQSPIIELFQKYDVDFQLHSYDHHQTNLKFEEDLAKAQRLFKSYFGKSAKAYRAPKYEIKKSDLISLAQSGIKVDSSCLKSWQSPNNFLISKKFFQENKIQELAPSALKPFMIPVSLSWQKLIGNNFFMFLLKIKQILSLDKEQPLVYVFHLHDLWVSDSFKELSPFWHFIYLRNKGNGLKYFKDLILFLKKENYQFKAIRDYLC